MRHVRRLSIATLASVAVLALSGCGFVGANDKSPQKPSGFVLFGHAAVALPKTDHRATGTACVSPVAGIAPGTPVKVLDPAGTALGLGSLGDGVIGHDSNVATCNFPFSIRDVPGTATTYRLVVGDQAGQDFVGETLRQNNAAIVAISG